MPEVKTTKELYEQGQHAIKQYRTNFWRQQWVRKEDYDALETNHNRVVNEWKNHAHSCMTVSSLRAEIEKIPNPWPSDIGTGYMAHNIVKTKIISLLDGVKE